MKRTEYDWEEYGKEPGIITLIGMLILAYLVVLPLCFVVDVVDYIWEKFHK